MRVKQIAVLLLVLICSQELVFNTQKSKAIENKQGALIVVNFNEDKKAFAGLIDRERNFDFPIDIISLQEKKISKLSPDRIRKFLWEQKDKYSFFVFEESIAYGEINDGGVITDYYYAHREGFFEYNKEGAKTFGTTVERYPELILSRLRQNQIGFYSETKKRTNGVFSLFGLPFVFFNRDQYICGVGTYQVDLSYTGYFLEQKLSRINQIIKVMEMYDDLSTNIHNPKYLTDRKQRKKPDMTLNSENFVKTESQKNFFLLINTPEPLYEEEKTNIYNEIFTSALWKDANRDESATSDEITKIDIQYFNKMNSSGNFSFYFTPTINRTDYISAPLIIAPSFTYGEESSSSPALGYFVGEDPEKSSASTFWNAILTDVAKGKTFAESTLLGYTNYFKIIKDDKDKYSQGLNATRLTFFGLPWYTIDDLIAQPEIQLKSDYYKVMGSAISVPIRNTGDKDLVIKIDQNDLFEPIDNMTLKPDEIKNLVIKKKSSIYQLNRLPRKSNIKIELQTNAKKHPKISLTIEFWE